MKAMNKILPLVMLLFIFMIASTYATGILSNADDGMDVDTDYQGQYDSGVTVHNATFGMLAPIGFIFGILIIITGIKLFAK